jgi:hypothetical protein
VAERCGDYEGAGRALLVLIEEMANSLTAEEIADLVKRINSFLGSSQNLSTQDRLRRTLELVDLPKTPAGRVDNSQSQEDLEL